jgi:hypothetical protein
MIDSHDIAELHRLSHPLDPPAIALGGVCRPAVERIAPALSGGTEVVRRYAGHDAGTTVGIEIEQRGIRPHVGAVRGDEDRQVADDVDAAGVGVVLQRRPLLVKAPLAELPETDFLALPVACFA